MATESRVNTPRSATAGSTSRLIESTRSGDAGSFNRLFRRYENTVFSFAFKVCRDRQNAEETLQDTYVNVFRNLHQFDGRSKFSTWLYSIVANNCLMKRRRTKIEKHAVNIEDIIARERSEDRLHGQATDTLPRWRNTPLEQMMGKELRARLDEAIGKLPVDYRMAFILPRMLPFQANLLSPEPMRISKKRCWRRISPSWSISGLRGAVRAG